MDGLYAVTLAHTNGLVDLSDLLRSEVAMIVSALDHYVHEVTRLGMIQIQQGNRLPTAAYLRFTVSMDAVRRGIALGGIGWLDDSIRESHSWKSFQQPDKIADAIRMISDIELWNQVGGVIGMPAADVKREVSVIVDRRHKIVHEADMDPSFPNTRWPITRVDAQNAVDFVVKVVEAIHGLVA